MAPFIKVAVALALTALSRVSADDDNGCDASATSCVECTGSSSSCGWCDGSLYINNELSSSHCIETSKNAWECDGTFKGSAQCDCSTGGAPASLVSLGVMRGFRVDNATDEVQLQISSGGVAEFINGAGRSNGTVTSIVGCPRSDKCSGDEVFFNFDASSASGSLSCTYRVDWQAGSNAHTVAMGCNSGGGEAPECFDDGAQLYVFYACLDQDHCPFAMGATSTSSSRRLGAAAAAAVPAPEAAAEVAPAPAEEVTDACSDLTTCGDCTANEACGWCIGNLFDTATDTARSGAKCFTMGPTYSCQGTTLTDSCDVYKCPWYEYFLQDPSTVGDCSALTCSSTTGDDPDFTRSNTPATAYATADACASNCVDPTVGCLNGTCAKTGTCDASSNCGNCADYHLPTVMAGVEIDAAYQTGVWLFQANANYTQMQWTSPGADGTTTTAAVQQWVYDGSGDEYTGEFVVTNKDGTSVVHAARMQFGSGALGTNVYLALSYDSTPIAWGQGVANAYNGTEFALFACNYQEETPVSGLGDPITCSL